MINDDAFVSVATANARPMVHLVYLFTKTHLLALLQDNCLELVRCAFLCKLSSCVRNRTAFCQRLLSPIKKTNTGRYRYIGLSLVSSFIFLDV